MVTDVFVNKVLTGSYTYHLARVGIHVGRFLNVRVQNSIDPYDPAHNRLKSDRYQWTFQRI